MYSKKYFVLLFTICYSLGKVYSQGTTTLTINTPTPVAMYSARDLIKLMPNAKLTAGATTTTQLVIDKNIIAPINVNGNPYSGYSVNGVYTIDKNLPVGAVNGDGGVNGGQSNYNIPIPISPGTSGMVPNISINYNSSQNGGIVGEGWGIGGLSSISRVQKDIYHMSAITPISLTSSDAFSLDGNRIWGTNTDGSKRLENDNFTDVMPLGNYTSFSVTTKSGMTMEYGATPDSKLMVFDNQNNSVPLVYYLNKVTDKNGNYYIYHYYNQNGEIAIKEIQYTGNSNLGLTPYNSIKFYYDSREDQNTRYFKGNELKTTLILREIEIFCEGKSFKKIVPTYNFLEGKSYLSSITEYGADNSYLNPTKFAYELPTFSYSGDVLDHANIAVTELPALADYKVADYNGDGKSDILAYLYSSVDPSSGLKSYTGWNLYINQNNGTTYNLVSSFVGAFFPYSYYGLPNTYSPDAEGLASMSFNGDEKEDAIFLQNVGGNTIYTPQYSTGNGFTAGQSFTIPSDAKLIFADIDGDKYTEGIAYSSSSNYLYILNFRYNQYQFGTPSSKVVDLMTPPQITSSAGITFNILNVIDYDGDGAQELLIEINSKARVIKFGQYVASAAPNSSNFILNILSSDDILPETGHCYTKENLYGDFNGDGLTDNLTRATDPTAQTIPPSLCPLSVPNLFFLRYNTSKYNSSNSSYYSSPAVPMAGIVTGRNNRNTKVMLFDMDNDGRTDIVSLYKDTINNLIELYVTYAYDLSNKTLIGTIYNINFHHVIDYNYYLGQTYPSNGNLMSEFSIGDFDGDSYTDIMFKNTNSGQRTIIYNHPRFTETKLAKVTNGFGRSIKFNYKTFAKGGVYTKGSGATYPFVDIQNPVKIVSSMELQDANDNFYSIDYTYEGAKASQVGQGFLGFDKITTTNNLTQTKVVGENSFNSYVSTYALPSGQTQFISGFAYRTPTNTKKYLLSNLSSPISETTNTYDYVNSNGPILPSLSIGIGHYIKLTQSISQDYVYGSTSITDYTYDQYHNLTNSVTQSNTGQNITTSNIIDANLYGNKYPSFIQSSTTNVTRTGKPTITKTAGFTYYSNGLLNQVTNNASQTSCSNSTSFVYNAAGQVTSSTSSSTNNSPRTATFEYDTKYRFVTKTTNPLNHFSQAVYDSRFGVPLQTTDITNLTTKYTYDAYGRNISITTPDNNSVTNIIKWHDSNDDISGDPFPASNVLITTQTNAPNTPFARSFYTASGLNVKSITEGFNQNFVSNLSSYNNLGQLNTAKDNYLIPCANPSQVLTKTNSYNDPFFRPTSTSVTDGVSPALTTNISYNNTAGVNKTFVTTPDGQTKTTTTDAFGLTTSVQDNGGTITYDYFSDGQIKSTTLNGANTYEYTYDACGNLATQNEPNNGLTAFTFDGFGQLVSKVNDGKTYSFNYDILGRSTSFTGPEGTYAYTYITSGAGLENVETETGPGGFMNKYYYDALNRVFKTDQTVGSTYSSIVEYDQYSNPIKYIYPSGFAIKMAYNSLGYPTTIKNDANNTLIWQADEINSFGNYNKYTLGNNLQSVDTYNNFGMLQNTSAGNVFDLSYNFNITNGNLNSLTDNIKDLQEVHTYDNLDRLTSSTVTDNFNSIVYPPLSLIYDAKGNITSKSDIGNYKYFSAKPNAVQKVENTQGLISTNQQDITYNAFEKAVNITENQDEQAVFTYGPNQERIIAQFSNIALGANYSTRYYLGDYEKEVKTGMTREVHYISAPTGLVAMHVIENGVANTYFTYSDHLGTPRTITNANGNVVAEQNFDPWGQRRNPNTWDYNNVPTPPAWLFRGYTGHEHLPQFSLINMNGRMYDPQNARMLSADPILHDATSTQAYNKYSYCINNPLKYTDPSGYDFTFNTNNNDIVFESKYFGSSDGAGDVDLSMNLNGNGYSAIHPNGGFSSSDGTQSIASLINSQEGKYMGETIEHSTTTEESYLTSIFDGISKKVIKTTDVWEITSKYSRISLAGGGDPPGLGPYLRSLDRKLEKWGQEFFSSLKPVDQAMAKENGAAHNTLKVLQTINPSSGFANGINYVFGNGQTITGGKQTGASAAIGFGLSFFPYAGKMIGNINVNIYRAYGGGSYAYGRSWSLINPKYYGATYRFFGGIPSANTMQFGIKATTKINNIYLLRPALPILKEFKLGIFVPEVLLKNPKNIQVLKLGFN